MRAVPVRFYTQLSDLDPVPWEWVDEQLRDAPTYWVTAAGNEPPHPRPVWGVWHGGALWLSVGSPALRAAIASGSALAVHLDSGTEPVIVEGRAVDGDGDQSGPIAAYDEKYDWTYDADEYGALVHVAPDTVFAWRTAGFAGRESFQTVGKWVPGPGRSERRRRHM